MASTESTAAPTYELSYFDGRGLAETTRLLFAVGNQPFEDFRFPIKVIDWGTYQFERNEFDAAKKEGMLKKSLGKVPFLRTDGIVIPQSKAIERFVARRLGLMGASDTDAALIDAFCEHLRDVTAMYQPFRKLEGDTKAVQMAKFFTEALPERFQEMEASLEDEQPWIVGSTISLADISLFSLVQFFNARERVLKALDAAPRLRDVYSKVTALPQIVEWLQRRPETPF